jgi:hypothetical protein
MTPDRISECIREGYTFICATCPHLHRAKEHGLDTCFGNLNGKTCSGPLNQQAYPEYCGPLKGNLTACCFLTGQSPVGAVDVRGVLLGVSERAIEVLSCYSRRGHFAPPSITHKHLPVLE